MCMQVVNLLPALRARVEHDAKTAIGVWLAALFKRQLRGQHHDFSQQSFIRRYRVGHRDDVLFRHDQKMHGRSRVDVVKGENFFIFIHLAAGNVACSNLAKQAIGVVRNVCVFGHGRGKIVVFSS